MEEIEFCTVIKYICFLFSQSAGITALEGVLSLRLQPAGIIALEGVLSLRLHEFDFT